MMSRTHAALVILLVLSLAGCGGAAGPTLSANDVASTAMALAWTQVGQTQAAMPTATPVPPTATFLPTPTILPATIMAPPPIGVPATETLDVCHQPPPAEPKGLTTHVTFVNRSGGQVNLAFGMRTPNAKGECGTYSYSLGVFERPTVTVLAGCYWGYAWITGSKPSVAESITNLCVTDSAKTYSISIGTEVIDFK